MDEFHEAAYLQHRPDVVEAIKAGQFISARQHYDLFGHSDEHLDLAIDVFETATAETFFEEGYLLANPDVRAFVDAGNSAWTHLHDFGLVEGRRQVSRRFHAHRVGATGRAKFERFAPVIDAKRSAGTYLEGPGRFPWVLSGQHYSRDDYKAESANPALHLFLREVKANPDKLYLDLGCGLRDKVYPNCLYVEVYPSLTADIVVSPTCTYPIRSESLDGLGTFAVLEHTRKPWLVAAEIQRMLKPGGSLYVDWPFLQPLHGYPSHFFNATREGLLSLFSDGFEVRKCSTFGWQRPDFTIEWILGEFSRRLPEGKRERLMGMTLRDLLDHPGGTPFWKDMLNGLPDEVLSEFACGNTLIGSKVQKRPPLLKRALQRLRRLAGDTARNHCSNPTKEERPTKDLAS